MAFWGGKQFFKSDIAVSCVLPGSLVVTDQSLGAKLRVVIFRIYSKTERDSTLPETNSSHLIIGRAPKGN